MCLFRLVSDRHALARRMIANVTQRGRSDCDGGHGRAFARANGIESAPGGKVPAPPAVPAADPPDAGFGKHGGLWNPSRFDATMRPSCSDGRDG
jgi:hypothetical protein